MVFLGVMTSLSVSVVLCLTYSAANGVSDGGYYSGFMIESA